MIRRVNPASVTEWLTQGAPADEIFRPTIPPRITADQLGEWFADALKHDDPRPPLAALETLAGNIAHLREAPWPGAISEERERRAYMAVRLAQQLQFAISKWSELLPAHDRAENNPYLPLHRVSAALFDVGILPIEPAPDKSPRGQPRAHWHRYARKLAELVSGTLGECGYGRSVIATDERTPVAILGARIVSEIYGEDLPAAGFASAMRTRDRAKPDPSAWDRDVPRQTPGRKG
jgi:hypothetical protein